MIASEHVATLGTRSTISGWAAISPSRKSSRFARHRVHRHPDYPASLGLDPTGQTRIEQAQQATQSTSPQERASRWRDNLEGSDGRRVDFANMKDDTFVYLPDGDRVPVAVAKRSGFLTTDASGRLIMQGEGNFSSPQQNTNDKPAAEESNKANEQNEPVRWSNVNVDHIMSTVGSKLPETTLEGLVAYGSTGAMELTESQAHALAQTLRSDGRGELTPEDAAMYYREAVSAAVDEANKIVMEQANVKDLDGFYSWMEANHRAELHEIRDSFCRGDARPLVKAAKNFAASHPDAGVSPDTIEAVMAEGNTVNGGRLHRAENGVAYVTFDSGETMPLAAALRAGYVKVS
jgi:hypothetical protein